MMNKSVALLLISLVVSLPIYSSTALAQLVTVNGHGEDDVVGYARNEEDLFTFNAVLSDNPAPDQLELFGNGAGTGFPFTSCQPAGNGFQCSLTDVDLSSLQMCSGGSSSNVINYYDTSGSLLSAQSARVVCDGTAPAVTLSADTLTAGGDTNITLVYEIREQADTSTNSECVGVAEALLESDGFSATLATTGCLTQSSLEISPSSFDDGVHVFEVTARDEFDNQGSSNMVSVTIDNTAPVLQLADFIVEDVTGTLLNYFKDQDVRGSFTLTVIDHTETTVHADLAAFGGGIEPASCTVIVNNSRNCTWSNIDFHLDQPTISFDVPVTSVDQAGNQNDVVITLSKTLAVDSTPPSVLNLNVSNVAAQNISGFTNDDSFGFDFTVDIRDTESGVVEQSIRADLSGVNPSYSILIPKDSCESGSGITRCRWNSVVTRIDESRNSAAIVINVSDRSGNAAAVSVPFTFPVQSDLTGPVVTGLKTDRVDDRLANSGSNTFVATVTEAGVGLSTHQMFLDASDLGGGSSIEASECVAGWTCYWRDVALGSSSKQGRVVVTTQSKDDLGNLMNDPFSADFIVDAESPSVVSVTITALSSSRRAVPGLIQTGNTLVIEANVSDTTPIEAVADLSTIVNGSVLAFPDQCRFEENFSICVWGTAEVDVEGPLDTSITFNFTDAAGNTVVHEEPVRVVKASDVLADFWEAEVGLPSPAGVDKQLLTFYEPFVWFPITLRSTEGLLPAQRWPATVEVLSCSNNNESFGSLLSSANDNLPEISNFNSVDPGQGPYQVFLKYTLDRGIPPRDDVPITCELGITTLVDNDAVSLPETENVSVIISYFNNPLGTLQAGVEDEIEAVKNNWLVKQDWLDSAQKLLDVAQTICRMVYFYNSLRLAWAAVKDIQTIQCNSGIGSLSGCPAAAAAGATTQATKITGHGLVNKLSSWCKILSCQYGIGASDSGKPTKNIIRRLGNHARSLAEKQEYRQGYWGNVLSGDPQNSLVLSAATLCLPGVIYNLQKARAVECQYINCLKNTEFGYPVQFCTAQHSYGVCKFVVGEIFQLIPFASAISTIAQNVRQALADPLSLLGVGLTVYCTQTCSIPAGTPTCKVCSIVEFASLSFDLLCDLGIGNGCESFWDELIVDDTVCEVALADE